MRGILPSISSSMFLLSFFRRNVLEKQDWKSIVEWVGNAKQVVSLVQDVARNLSDYANFTKISDSGLTLPYLLC